MRRRLPPPFNIRRMFRDPQGLITRLELAFALEPVHKLKPVVSMRDAPAPVSKRASGTGSEPDSKSALEGGSESGAREMSATDPATDPGPKE